MDLFNELLKTTVDAIEADKIAYSHFVCIPSLGYLHRMADFVTVDRCIKKLQAERRELEEIL